MAGQTDTVIGTGPVNETQWFLFRRKFRRHKLAMVALKVLGVLFTVGVLFPGFFRAISSIEIIRPHTASPQNSCIALADICARLRPYTYTLLSRRENQAAARNGAFCPLQLRDVDGGHFDATPHQLFQCAGKRRRIN